MGKGVPAIVAALLALGCASPRLSEPSWDPELLLAQLDHHFERLAQACGRELIGREP